jgi:hypothetical protein
MDVDACEFLEVKVADDRGLHMDVDECVFLEVKVAGDRGLFMDGDVCILFEMNAAMSVNYRWMLMCMHF